MRDNHYNELTPHLNDIMNDIILITKKEEENRFIDAINKEFEKSDNSYNEMEHMEDYDENHQDNDNEIDNNKVIKNDEIGIEEIYTINNENNNNINENIFINNYNESNN